MAQLEQAWAFWFTALRQDAGFADRAQFDSVEFSLRCDFCETALWIAKNEFDSLEQLQGADDPSLWSGAEQRTVVELAQVRRLMRVRKRSRSRCMWFRRVSAWFRCAKFGQGPG